MNTLPATVTWEFARIETSPQYAVEIEEDFTFNVLLYEGGGHPVSGKVVKLVGSRLISQVSEYIERDTCVQIDCDDAFLQGEVLSCWCEGRATFVAVKLMQALTGLKELARLREEYLDSPHPLKLEVLQRALV
jgi:hypothetical protein